MNERLVTIKSIDDKTVTVQGWGVVFDGADLDGESFSKDTDFALDLVPVKPIFYDHRLEQVKNQLGSTKSVQFKDDQSIAGLWVEAQLDRSQAYVEEVIQLVEKGILGWSSGSAGHLIDRAGKSIKRWPIIEFSLTPTPAEPRTLGVEQLKTLITAHPEFQIFLSEAGEATGEMKGAKANKEKQMETQELTKEQIEAIEAKAAQKALADEKARVEEENADKKAYEERVAAEVKAKLEDEDTLKSAGYIKNINISKGGIGGDDQTKAYLSYLRSGQSNQFYKNGSPADIKASNDTDMNVGTAADGGNAVPTGHYQGIIAKRDENMLAPKLGVRRIPGVGTTVNVPLDNEADGEFISTAEAASFNRDAPALDTVAMTLTKYTKRIELSYELLQDEDSRLLAFLDDFVGRGLAKTHNNLLLTAVASSGTSFKTFANDSTVGAGELEDILGNNDLDPYLNDDASVAWVMRNSTFWKIKSLRTASGRTYAVGGDPLLGKELLGYPVHTSQKAAAIASSAKSIYFGNWNFVGMREAPGLTVLRDPYSRAAYGQLVLHYYFRTVYNVLQSEAIGYGVHAAS